MEEENTRWRQPSCFGGCPQSRGFVIAMSRVPHISPPLRDVGFAFDCSHYAVTHGPPPNSPSCIFPEHLSGGTIAPRISPNQNRFPRPQDHSRDRRRPRLLLLRLHRYRHSRSPCLQRHVSLSILPLLL